MAHILLAEDDEAMREFIFTALIRAGYDVTSAEDGLEALKKLEEKPAEFDLLLSDIVMPGMDGIELAQRASSLNPKIKTMFITGFSARALSENTNESGALPNQAQILSKPFHLGDLVTKITELLERA